MSISKFFKNTISTIKCKPKDAKNLGNALEKLANEINTDRKKNIPMNKDYWVNLSYTMSQENTVLKKYIRYAEIFKIVIENLSKQKQNSKVEEIEKLINSDALSFKYYDNYIAANKNKILKEKDKGELSLQDFLPLIKFYEYSEDNKLYNIFLI